MVNRIKRIAISSTKQLAQGNMYIHLWWCVGCGRNFLFSLVETAGIFKGNKKKLCAIYHLAASNRQRTRYTRSSDAEWYQISFYSSQKQLDDEGKKKTVEKGGHVKRRITHLLSVSRLISTFSISIFIEIYRTYISASLARTPDTFINRSANVRSQVWRHQRWFFFPSFIWEMKTIGIEADVTVR